MEQPQSVLQMVSEIQTLMGCTGLSLVIENSSQGEIRDQYLSAKKAREILS